ncbi:ABC transporter ATP-binding protein [Prauserella cavernicola]|uniref:ABC transporter ATP-binding protein n=1 Tax=Prauserella cavernicola TaxID=2800127 RepID=A0A934V2U7_9PSEU|nr:ABC transporter ATP-binding protein [Prauserella cavernicola]MBK1782829.1 ABC transporter ATP-binding protein [Prauserella cavernicola]
MTPADHALSCSRVSHSYPVDDAPVRALADVSLTASRGAVTVLAGPSGSGKSTLLRILGCLDRPDEGSVEVEGVVTTALSTRRRRALRRARIGYVFQDPADNLLGYLTVAEHVALGARLRGGDGTGGGSAAVLEALGVADRAGHRPAQLSGGEQQRVALAFAAAGEPPVLLADEPSAQLDRAATGLVVGALRELAARGHAVVVTTHDPEVLAVADEVIDLVDGERRERA